MSKMKGFDECCFEAHNPNQQVHNCLKIKKYHPRSYAKLLSVASILTK